MSERMSQGERPKRPDSHGIDRRHLLRALLAAGAVAALSSKVSASRDLEDLSPPELLARMRKELAPGGHMREWLEGDRTPNEILSFLKTLMPLVRELEKVHHGGSRYRELQALAVDPHSIPHQYLATFRTPGGMVKMGHGIIVVHEQEAFLVTARHVIEGTIAEGAFSVMRDERGVPDVAAVPIDINKSLPTLERLRRITSTSPHMALSRVSNDASDRGGRLFVFSSELHNEFDFTLRLAVPLTPALCNALSVLSAPDQGKLLDIPFSGLHGRVREEAYKISQECGVFFIGPEDFVDRRPTGALRAQGRSGGAVFDAETLEYHGPLTAALGRKVRGIDRSILLVAGAHITARLCAAIRSERRPAIAIDAIPGLSLKTPGRWLTWVNEAHNHNDVSTGRFNFGAGLMR